MSGEENDLSSREDVAREIFEILAQNPAVFHTFVDVEEPHTVGMMTTGSHSYRIEVESLESPETPESLIRKQVAEELRAKALKDWPGIGEFLEDILGVVRGTSQG